MPGLVHFDFGDAIRSAANTADESEPDLSKINFNIPVYEAFTKGFLREANDFLTKLESETLSFAPVFMTFIMGLRFLTDFIEGDVSYKIKYPEHNLVRALNQFCLVKKMEERRTQSEEIVKKYSKL